ncbi:hypothetical protein GBAR_LOCUS19999 [Geodia barretti]|uniref:Uncharacterized protein n=1 Tax=Geodia barretti TaxID=519541 RepID=A0AA35X2R0_GEOBA|nr:hypothetical protein GBAR_LOCUS19999 [Geodia barretti]
MTSESDVDIGTEMTSWWLQTWLSTDTIFWQKFT